MSALDQVPSPSRFFIIAPSRREWGLIFLLPRSKWLAKMPQKQRGATTTFIESDLFFSLTPEDRFDVIVSNPPYVRDHEWETLDVEVRNFEPKLALCAGDDGLDILRRLILESPRWLNPGGWLLAEFGIDQQSTLREKIEGTGLYDSPIFVEDHARKPRVFAHGSINVSEFGQVMRTFRPEVNTTCSESASLRN